MPRSKKQNTDEAWGYYGNQSRVGERPASAFAELARTTKLRTLRDMSEDEIRALERLYGCRVIRPKTRRRTALAA